MSDLATTTAVTVQDVPRRINWFLPHRIVMILIFVAGVILAATTMRWDWLPQYQGQLVAGVGRTLMLLFSSAAVGMVLALLLGLVQVTGPRPLSWLATGFCSIIRGTPLLLQLWL
ncbi:MAG: ABC transporter permease, partial [Alphaproteobacteria bacterium]